MASRWMNLSVLAVVLISATAAVRADAKDDELAKLKGTWTIVTANKEGQDMPAEAAAKIAFVIEGDTMSMVQGDHKDPATVKSIDPSKSPAWIDVAGKSGKITPGIYKLDGDTLELCMKQASRPTEFRQGKDTMYLKLKRKK